MITTIDTEHFAKPNCTHSSNLQQSYEHQTSVIV